MTIPASRAVTKLEIWSDGYMALTRINIRAFITIINSPSDSKIAGNDNSTTTGLTTKLTRAKIKPEITITVNLLL
jgi:hypothetical protein